MAEHLLAPASEIKEGELFSKRIGDAPVVATRLKDGVVAVSGKCPHMGLSLAKGKIQDGAIKCFFHGATFDLKTGKNLQWANSALGVPLPSWSHKLLAMGKEPCNLKTYPVTEKDGSIYVSLS